MSVLSPGRNIVLIGLMGTGKSAVGQILAEDLGRSFADTDAMVEAEAGQSVAELFAQVGERGFRRLEAEAVRRVSALRGQVVAVGGGAVLDPSNVTHLRATGDLVLLDAEPATLAERLAGEQGKTRPLLDGAADPVARLAELRVARNAAYRRCAAHTVDTTARSPKQVAAEVLAWARSRRGVLSREELER
ncbi:MAG TPA: shikimate kinase [Egibacteraceae bacterium]|nr:shikimate kinase [Egibacteraceae bacterium]